MHGAAGRPGSVLARGMASFEMKNKFTEHANGAGVRPKAPRRLGLWALVAATYCMVAGGPFGLEDLVQKSGYAGALAILVLTPIFWALPTTLMVSELSSALPLEGGFYVWARRALGRFWGFQESWLSLVGSVFDMAIYPTLFIAYLTRLWPALQENGRGLAVGLVMIAACVVWNLLGVRAVGEGSLLVTLALLAPFGVIAFKALAHGSLSAFGAHPHPRNVDWLGGILIAMWNYMGWDNPSTIAGEVAQAETAYPSAMKISLAIVTFTYVLPVGAVAFTAISPDAWSTGGWVDIARMISGNGLAVAVMLAGAAAAVCTFNALVLSLSRLPFVMAEDGFLPAVFRRCNRRGVPWVAVLACAAGWGLCTTLGFERVLLLDVLLSGGSVLLEFAALIALRIKEPQLARPYKVRGGTAGAVAVSLAPAALILIAVFRNSAASVGPVSALTLGLALVFLGWVVYFLSEKFRRPGRA